MPTVTELWNRSGEVDSVGRYSFTRQFRVLAENRKISQIQVLSAVAAAPWGVTIGAKWTIGSVGQSWYETANVYCTRISCECAADEDGTAWNVTASWEPAELAMLTANAIPADPTAAPVLVEWGEWSETYALYRDRNDKILVNTAGDRFSEPIDSERHYPLMTVRRKQRTFDAPYYSDYKDTVNASTWVVKGTTIPARVAKCVSITGQPEWHQDFGIFYDVTFQFAIRDEAAWTDVKGASYQGWDVRVANVGYRYKGTDGKLYLITDSNGVPYPDPVPLDVNGNPLPLPISPTTEIPTLGYRIYREANFTTGFGFPTA